jgi:hypothetical protein
MTEKKQLEYFLLRYVPYAARRGTVNIGVILLEDSPDGFAELRFLKNWKTLEQFDADADVEALEAMERYIRREFEQPDTRKVLLKKLNDSFSGWIELSQGNGIVSAEPVKEIEILNSFYLEPVQSAPRQTQSERGKIWQQMRSAFEQQGILNLMMTDIAMNLYTKPGDPMKIDFGYIAGHNVKLFHAVTLRASATQAITLASRFPYIAQGIVRETGAGPILTAVVDDDLDQNRPEVRFALEMMNENGVLVANMGDMPRIGEQARKDLMVNIF